MKPFTVRFNFHGDLTFFLGRKARVEIIERSLSEKTSVKDAVEAGGVPHPEVDLILADGRPVNFGYALERDTDIDVYPVQSACTYFEKDQLQIRGIKRFVADGHLGKLTRNLRLLGFDVAYDRQAQDRQLLGVMESENRALLTRDRRLLMHAIVKAGYTRCLRCNAPLQKVAKADVLEKLEPLTKIYYEEFRSCSGCGQIYWAGSHFSKLQKRLDEIRANFSD